MVAHVVVALVLGSLIGLGMVVIRHGDAGYERASKVARERGVRIPMCEDGGR